MQITIQITNKNETDPHKILHELIKELKKLTPQEEINAQMGWVTDEHDSYIAFQRDSWM